MPIKRGALGRSIDRYLLSEVLGPFIGSLILFSFIILMFQIVRMAELFIQHGISGWVLLRMSGLILLSILPMAMPASFLIGTLIAFGRLSADSEIVAMKANGIGLNRIALPTLVLAAAVSAIGFALNLEWVPWGERESKALLVKVGNTTAISSVKEGTFTTGFFDLLIYAEKVEAKTNRMANVFLYDERESKSPLVVLAKEGEIVPVKTESQLGAAVMLKLYDGNIHHNDQDFGTYQKVDFREYRLYLKIDEGSSSFVVKPRMLTHRELLDFMGHAEPGTEGAVESRAEYWKRIHVALAPFFFLLLGIGFGTFRTRSPRAGAALIAFLIILLYWVLLATTTVWVHRGLVPGWLALTLPNLAAATAGVFAYRSANW